MKLLLGIMNLTASSLNNIQNENALSIRTTMVVYFLYSHVLVTINTKIHVLDTFFYLFWSLKLIGEQKFNIVYDTDFPTFKNV